MFFTRFNFTLSYCPGSRNHKADALSPQHEEQETQQEPEFILPSPAHLAALHTDIEDRVLAANHDQPTPSNCPLFVPDCLRSEVIQ